MCQFSQKKKNENYSSLQSSKHSWLFRQTENWLIECTLFEVSLNFSAIWHCESVPNGNWTEHFSFLFLPLSRVFALQMYRVKLACLHWDSNPRPPELKSPAITTRPSHHIHVTNNFYIKKNFLWLFTKEPKKWKIPVILQNYFSGQ